MTVCTNDPAGIVMERVKEQFGDMEPEEIVRPVVEKPAKPVSVVYGHQPMEKEQIYIYLGGPTAGIGSEDAAALKLAGSILSDRMALELRERQGLAYSVGASISFDHDFGWYVAAMGTGSENFEIARDGMLDEISKLQHGSIEPLELKKAKNSLWGSHLMRNLSRINQAYYMGVYEFLGVGYDHGDEWIDELQQVSADDVKRVANEYFSTENYIIATAGIRP
jgi:predicted Zn-dependent peptidase